LSGSTARFWRSFFGLLSEKKVYESVEALQADLDVWLVHYNTERPHRGYHNMRRTPIATIESFFKNERQEP